MPTPTIPAGNLFMNATLYTGNGGNLTVTNGAAGQSFQPDFVWTKSRSNGSTNHLLEDVIRGPKNSLLSNGVNTELARGINAFLSNGFSFNDDASGDGNVNGQTYVGWQWKAGGAAVTNTAGSISAQVSANTTSGFSVVTYTGNGAVGATVGHGLGVAPSMIIIKRRTGSTASWLVWHRSLSNLNNNYLLLDTNNGELSSTNIWGTQTSSVIALDTDSLVNEQNANGSTFVAYCWAPIAGYSAFGSYTGNGSSDGPFTYLGFRPRYVLIKRTDSAGGWMISDTSRYPYNVVNGALEAQSSSAEFNNDSFYQYDIVSNGIKIRGTSSAINSSGGTYIYACFAENPFKYALAR
jgi:hypothetical protein